MVECPFCENLKRKGIEDSEAAIRYSMLWQNIYVKKVVELIGFDKATFLASVVSKEVEIELKKQDN